jgi:hypothetical protein
MSKLLECARCGITTSVGESPFGSAPGLFRALGWREAVGLSNGHAAFVDVCPECVEKRGRS